jgi:hypothetical protein
MSKVKVVDDLHVLAKWNSFNNTNLAQVVLLDSEWFLLEKDITVDLEKISHYLLERQVTVGPEELKVKVSLV